MPVLGVETSCDETGVALVEHGRLVVQKLATQVELHGLFGGVVPEMASREHLRLLPRLFASLLEDTGLAPSAIEAVAVSRGPGLLGALLVGVSFAKGLCLATGARLIGVNHLHAHLLASGLERDLVFPALGLLVSGGHTHTYAIRGPNEFELLGRTLDDAAGEALDKAAKHMNLPYPGGRHVDRLAKGLPPGEEIDKTLFPRAFVDTPSLDFSFSGLKTAVCGHLDAHPELRFERPDQGLDPNGEVEPDPARSQVCAALNWAVADTLRIKAERALTRMSRDGTRARALIVAGGVAANSMVREAMAALAGEHGLEMILPSKGLCTDNAAMVAHAGWLLHRAGLCHDLDLEAVPRGRRLPEDYRCFSAGPALS